MERNHVLGMVCGYFLSRLDADAYARLGHPTQDATHSALAAALEVRAESIKNWRDEFDPLHPNHRRGWHNREMYPSRRRTAEALGNLTADELLTLVRAIVSSPKGTAADALVKLLEAQLSIDATDSVPYSLRGPTGIAAEHAFADYHNATGEPISGELVDRRAEGVGFDYEITFAGSSVAVEVKGLAGDTGGITFTDKEWTTAKKMGNRYFLVLVRRAATDPQISILKDPAGHFDAQMRTFTTVQVGWAVPELHIREAEKLPQ